MTMSATIPGTRRQESRVKESGTVLETSEPESELVAPAGRGDARAFESLYRAHAPRLHALCRRLAGDPEQAEDLTQEVFLRAWQRLDGFGGRSKFYSWLYRLAVNAAIDRHRSHRRKAGKETTLEEWEEFVEPRKEHTARRMDLEKAIDGLPPTARMVFVLHDVEGYRHEDIAEMTGLASGTCRAHLHRARRLLRNELQP